MIQAADLHIHTQYSDSTLSVREALELAAGQGIGCISITDHDTVAAMDEAFQVAGQYDVEVIPGIELSSQIEGQDIHMLGYFIDTTCQPFLARLASIQQVRVERLAEMIQRLKDDGVDNISLEEVLQSAPDSVIGRPHLARILVEKGWVSSMRDAFDKYIGNDKAAFVPNRSQSPYEAIEWINKAGGMAVMAHPMVTQKDELIPSFVEAGMRGLEVFYPNVPSAVTEFYRHLAEKHGLLMTGGSDAHGSVKAHTHIGKLKLPYEYVLKLKEEKARIGSGYAANG